MTVIITLTTAGADTGPFNLYSDLDGYVSAFETGVAKVDLLAGYTSTLVPDGTTIIRVASDSLLCTNYIDISVDVCTTTTTTTAVPQDCAIYAVYSDVGGGTWSGTSCSTGLPVSGIVPSSGSILTECILVGSLVLNSASVGATFSC
mgnify:CR=1 FL=1